MFGWGKKRDESKRFVALNPICAPIFLELADDFTYKFSKRRMDLEFVFAPEAIIELDTEYNNCRAALQQIGVNELIDTASAQIVNSCLRDADIYGQYDNPDLVGMSSATLYVRKIVFGIAPASSSEETSETPNITMKLMLKIIKLLNAKTPNMFLSGVSVMFSLFGMKFAKALNNKSLSDEFISLSGVANRQLKLMGSKNRI